MTFGKRGVSTPDGGGKDRPATRRGSTDWSVSKTDIALALGVATAVFTGVYLFAGEAISAFGPARSQAPATPVFAYQAERFERTYGAQRSAELPDGHDGAMVLAMTGAPGRLDAIDDELQERCLRLIDGNAARYAEQNGRVALHAQTGARLLVCSMQVFKARMCEPSYKNRLVAQLQEFVRARRAGLGLQREAPGPAAAVPGLDVAGTKTARAPIQVVPAILADQLRAFSDQSLLSQNDFGHAMPEELRPYVGPAAAASPCA
ncbi:hypothetical protein ACQKKX_12620 [Neorhizobium sp. NPDC001467]|uniref:hypothetical protein n=1 Tax=Neorhizobium sp. NPDC001467 TaxID=3390595 RepID=UPI003CFE82BA